MVSNSLCLAECVPSHPTNSLHHRRETVPRRHLCVVAVDNRRHVRFLLQCIYSVVYEIFGKYTICIKLHSRWPCVTSYSTVTHCHWSECGTVWHDVKEFGSCELCTNSHTVYVRCVTYHLQWDKDSVDSSERVHRVIAISRLFPILCIKLWPRELRPLFFEK